MFFASSSEIRVIIGGHRAQPSPAMAEFLPDHMAIHLPGQDRASYQPLFRACVQYWPCLTAVYQEPGWLWVVGRITESKFWSHGCIKVWLQFFCWILVANLFEVSSYIAVSRFWLHIRGYGITVSGFWSHNCRPTVATSDAWFPCRQCTGRTQAVRSVHSLDSLSRERSRQRWMSLGFRMCWFGTCI